LSSEPGATLPSSQDEDEDEDSKNDDDDDESGGDDALPCSSLLGRAAK
jgi:hypothetical protein